MGVSLNDGTPKTAQNDHFLVGKPMVVGYHHFRKPPNDRFFLVGKHTCLSLFERSFHRKNRLQNPENWEY